MTATESRDPRGRTILLAHPSADLYGSDRVALESIGALVDAGWRVVVTVPADGPMVAAVATLGGAVVVCPTLVLRKSLLAPSGWGTLLRQTVIGTIRGARLLLRERPAAIYVNTVTIPLWPPLARLLRVRVLAHVHEAEGSAPRPVRVALAVPLLFAQAVVTNSRFSVGVLRRSLPSVARRTRVLSNGVPGPSRRVRGRDDVSDGVRLVYVGRLSPRKGVDVAVAAVAELRDRGVPARLDLVGAVFPGYEWFQAELEEQVRRLGLGDAVVMHGFCDDVWGLIAEGDVVLVPSRADEPFGNTAVEAVLSARPVIASATSGLLEATHGYACAQTIQPGSPEAIADAVVTVIDDWQQWRDRAWADADVATDRHSPARYRAAVADELGRLAGAPR